MLKINSLSDYLVEEKTTIYKNQEHFEEILFPFKLLAWKKLSEHLSLPEEFDFFLFLKTNKNKHDFLEFAKSFSESDYAKAFRIFLSSDIKFLRKYDEQSLISYINRANLLDKYPDIDEFFNTLNKNIIHSSFLSDEIINFFINLLSLNRAEQIYNPYPDNYQLALKINNKLNKQVFTEDSFVTSLPYILNVLYDANLNISFSEPLINPSYKEGYNLQTFDTVVSILPAVRRLHINLNKDIYNRFNFKYVMLSHPLSAYILHILAQTKNKAYVIVPTNFLSRSFKADIEFRKLLLESSLVSNVILLPVNIFHRATIDCAIIIFDKQKLDKNIHFIDATALMKKSYEYMSEKVFNVLKSKIQESDFAYIVGMEDIEKNNYSLNPKSYLESKKIAKIFKNAKFIKLSEKVEIISSPFIKRKKGSLEVYELQPTDINDYGFINQPKNKVRVYLTETELEKNAIRKYDILLVTKGIKDTISKSGIVINKPEDEIWIAGQSISVLRAKSEGEAKALFMFLITDEARNILNSLATGSLLLNISAKSLKEMTIPELDNKKLENLYEEFLGNYKEIERIKALMRQFKLKIINFIEKE